MFGLVSIAASRNRSYPTQGSGAAALIAKPIVVGPKLTVHAISFPPQTFYFAATAEANGTNSDYSNEVLYRRTNNVQTVTLAWDRSPTTNLTITNYQVFKGRASGVYTNTYSAGTNLTLTVPLLPPPPTNLVIKVTSSGATNLQYATFMVGPWTKVNATNWTATNPPAPRFFRAMSNRAGSRVYVQRTMQ